MARKNKDQKKHGEEKFREMPEQSARMEEGPEPYYPGLPGQPDVNPDIPGGPVPGDPGDPDGAPEDERPPEIDPQTRQILETGSVTVARGRHPIHCITVVGQIEGHFILPPNNKTTKYEHVIPQIIAVDEDPELEGLLIILNTVGGDVEAGLAIAELIATMKKPTVSLVLGGGHSIGVPLAVATRRSFIVPTATMTIHPVRMNGLIVGVPQTLGYFYKMQDRIVKFVSDNSHITAKRFKELMMQNGELVLDVGTVLDGKAAVKEGLIDHLGGLSDAVECLYRLIEEQEDREERAKPRGKGKTAKTRPEAEAPEAAAPKPRGPREAAEAEGREAGRRAAREDGSRAGNGARRAAKSKGRPRGGAEKA